jgi:hypothetical protein
MVICNKVLQYNCQDLETMLLRAKQYPVDLRVKKGSEQKSIDEDMLDYD